MKNLVMTDRIKRLKEKMLSEPRYASIEQAKIITDTYKRNENKPRIIQRALALKAAMEQLEIRVEPEELIVGNRTAGVCAMESCFLKVGAPGWTENLKRYRPGRRTNFW